MPATSHLAERLTRRGLVQRRENPGNRREKLIEPTGPGLQVVAHMDEQFTCASIAAFRSARPETIRAASAAMEPLLAGLLPGTSQETA